MNKQICSIFNNKIVIEQYIPFKSASFTILRETSSLVCSPLVGVEVVQRQQYQNHCFQISCLNLMLNDHEHNTLILKQYISSNNRYFWWATDK